MARVGRLSCARRFPATTLQMCPRGGPGVVPAQCRVHERAYVADLVAAVVALALELDRPDRGALPRELRHAVCQPDLVASSGFLLLQDVEDLRLQDVPVHRREVAGS